VVLFKREETVPRANQSSRLDSQEPPESTKEKKGNERNATQRSQTPEEQDIFGGVMKIKGERGRECKLVRYNCTKKAGRNVFFVL
jgi:hypothetical protein